MAWSDLDEHEKDSVICDALILVTLGWVCLLVIGIWWLMN